MYDSREGIGRVESGTETENNAGVAKRCVEHAMRDDWDYATHMDYLHFNPVKHGWVNKVVDWPYSSFHHYLINGVYSMDWAGGDCKDIVMGER